MLTGLLVSLAASKIEPVITERIPLAEPASNCGLLERIGRVNKLGRKLGLVGKGS